MNDYKSVSNTRHKNIGGECIVLLLGAMLAGCGRGRRRFLSTASVTRTATRTRSAATAGLNRADADPAGH